MKNKGFLVLIVMCAALLGCGTVLQAEKNEKNEPIPDRAMTSLQEVMIDGVTYYNTFEESTVETRCGVMDGEITSAVAAHMIPMEDDQSNFGTGYAYQFTDYGTVEVLIDGKYMVFRAMYPQNSFGVSMDVEHVTECGLTAVITREEGQSDWEIVTGSQFFLLQLKDGTYAPYVRSDGLMIDLSWTMEAYLVQSEAPLTMDVDWTWLYDTLPSGTYRFGKRFSASRTVNGVLETDYFEVYVPIWID